jgi:MHS family proline/betaine transporter-like MFS transporter
MSGLSNRAKAILVSSIGGGLEIYDFTIYIFFAPILAALFFPHGNSLVTLLKTFSVFAVGYFARPLGAIIFGHFGDKLGRKKGMLYSIAIMAIATMGIGLLPSYASAGIIAPILLIMLRFFQGFAVGGDLPGAITFVAEYSENNKRGLYCSLVYCAVNIGLLLASLIGAVLTTLLSPNELAAWGWRIAFLLGLLIGVVGFYLRRKIAETPYFNQLEQAKDIIKVPLLHLFRTQRKQLLQSIGLVWPFAAVISQVFLYMPTYLNTVVKIELQEALIINSINIFIFSLCIPLVGYLSDKIGRKIVIVTVALLLSVLTYPLYTLLNSSQFIVQAAALICFAVLSAGIVGTVPATLAEMFPTPVRYSGVAISYNIGFAIFGGLTPVIATYLIYRLGFPQAPSINLIVSAIVALSVAVYLKDGSQKSL